METDFAYSLNELIQWVALAWLIWALESGGESDG